MVPPDEKSYITIRAWKAHALNDITEHVSLSITDEDKNQNQYISLYKGTANGKTFNPVWADSEEDMKIQKGRVEDRMIKLFSLNRVNMNIMFDHIRQNNSIHYHDSGDAFTEISPSYHSPSLTVELLKVGNIRDLFPTNQLSVRDSIWATTKGGIVTLGTVGVVTGSVVYAPLGVSATAAMVGIDTVAIAAGITTVGTVAATRFGFFDPAKICTDVWGFAKNMPKKAQQFTVGTYQEKKYGHPALAPLSSILHPTERFSALTLSDVVSLAEKAKEKEKISYPQTINWE